MVRSGIILSFLFIFSVTPFAQQTWGRLANSGYENETVKSVFFFTGNWRNGVQFYDYNPSDNTGFYTMHPSDARHLGWSESASNREFAIDEMISRGFNVINMSYWGVPGTDNWAWWAPMQTSTESHDELFDAAIGKDILIVPYIESFAATDNSPEFIFRNDFPGTSNNPAPQFITILEDLIDRYILNPENEQWPGKWARVYDQEGTERYLFSIIHVASDQPGITHQQFAEGFDRVANAVYDDTGIRIGFALDCLPPDATYAPGVLKPIPETTGNYMADQLSVLAIQCFIPEIWLGIDDIDSLLNWKESFTSRWISTGIPVILDVSSGYDANILFPTSPVYGNNSAWRTGQSQIISNINPDGLSFNSWNGYTEGLVAVSTLEYGDSTYTWICNVFNNGNCSSSTSGIMESTMKELIVNKVFLDGKQTINIEYVSFSNQVQINLIDISGRILLKTKPSCLQKGINKIKIETNRIISEDGIYFIQFITNNFVCTKSILVE